MTKEASIKEVSKRILQLMNKGHLRLDFVPISNRYSLLATEAKEIVGVAHTDGVRQGITNYVLIGDYVNIIRNGRSVIGMIDYIVNEKADCRIHIIGIDTNDERDQSFFAKLPQIKSRHAPRYHCIYTGIEITSH